MAPVTAMLEWHSSRTARFAFFAGGGYAHVFASDIDGGVLKETGTRLRVQNGGAVVATTGVIWRMDARGFAVFETRLMPLQLQASVADEALAVNVFPLMVSIGYGMRF